MSTCRTHQPRVALLLSSLVVAVIAGTATDAHASAWIYRWQCAGRCAPHQVAISGMEGPFETEESCNSARWSDSRRESFVAEGNQGGLELCELVDDATAARASGGSGRRGFISKVEIGVTGGAAWSAHDVNDQTTTAGGPSFGLDANLHVGPPVLGVLVRSAISSTPIASPSVMLDRERVTIFELLSLGLELNPGVVKIRRRELRATLAGWVGMSKMFGCDGCDRVVASGDYNGEWSGFSYGGRVGVELLFGRRHQRGVSLDVVYQHTTLGSLDEYQYFSNEPFEIAAPTWSIRLGYELMYPH